MSNKPDHIPPANSGANPPHLGRTGGALKGKVIIYTYPEKEQDDLVEILTAQGAIVLSMPVIEILPLSFQLEKNISEYDWLVFTSKNAVRPFAGQFPVISNKVAALGKQTAKQLQQFKFEPQFIGSGKSANDFAQEFLEVLQENDKVLLVLGNLAPNILQHELMEKAAIDRINVYQTIPLHYMDKEIFNRVKNDQYDVLIISSPSSVKSLIKRLNKRQQQLRIISIGKTTTNAIREFHMQPLATSAEPTYRGLAQTTIDYFKNDHEKLKI